MDDKGLRINFLCIGAQKAGTSWLDKRLRELPDFSMLPKKEVHYFDRSIEYPSPSFLSETLLHNRLKNLAWSQKAIKKIKRAKEKGNADEVDWLIKWFFSDYTDEWYLSLFDAFEGFTGEITPSYSILKEYDIQRLHQLLPEVRLILLLRNPIDRAWSHYRSRRANKHKSLNKIAFEKDIIQFINNENQELRSNYLRTIDSYGKYFSKEQILICFFEALEERPLRLLNEIVSFIGGDSSNIERCCRLEHKANVSVQVEMPENVHSFLKDKYRIQIESLSNMFGGYCTNWLLKLNGDNQIVGDFDVTFTMPP